VAWVTIVPIRPIRAPAGECADEPFQWIVVEMTYCAGQPLHSHFLRQLPRLLRSFEK
jgi:hypothetical protein